MKQSLASSPAAVWNRKNLPSDIERVSQTPGRGAAMLRQAPAATLNALRQRPELAFASLVAIGAIGLLWFFLKRD